jgi:hypothetical protein
MEFLLYLTPIGRDIYDLISKKVKILENPPICRTHNIYGWYNSSKDTMSICTENIKNGPDPQYYMNETLYHESVHVAQDCNAKWSGQWYKPFNINPSIMTLTQRRLSDLSTSVKLNNQDRQIEHEAFWMEDKPEKVKYVVQKYCF